MQCVIALTPGAFDVWPYSHKMSVGLRPGRDEHGHFHLHERTKLSLHANCERCVFACSPGDVLVFKGGFTFHGSPAIGGDQPTPRIMTYATHWPPGTKKGQEIDLGWRARAKNVHPA